MVVQEKPHIARESLTLIFFMYKLKREENKEVILLEDSCRKGFLRLRHLLYVDIFRSTLVCSICMYISGYLCVIKKRKKRDGKNKKVIFFDIQFARDFSVLEITFTNRIKRKGSRQLFWDQ